MKPCNGCTACCFLLEIPSLEKAVNSPCAHCTGAGCKIYGRHPAECVEFNCLWRSSPVMGEDLRPDRCGVMFDLYLPEKMVIGNTTEQEAWLSGQPMKLIKRMVADGFVVWIIDGSNRHLLLPEGVTEAEGYAKAQAAWKRTYGGA